MKKHVICTAAVLSLAGCAWHHPTATAQDFARDRYQCQNETANTYPTMQAPVGVGYQRPGTVNCTTYGATTNCTTQAGAYVPAPTQDTNAIPRAMGFNACMGARGYYK